MSSETGRERGSGPALAPVEHGQPETPAAARSAQKKTRKTAVLAVVAIAALAGLAFGVKEVVFYRHHVETDDAYVQGHIDPVLPKVSGYVLRVLIDDNQRVAAGQVLLEIDPRDLKARVDMARAAVEDSRAKVEVARANVATARTESARAAADFERYAVLFQKATASRQQYDTAKAAASAAADAVVAGQRGVAAAEAEVAQKQADLDLAGLQLSYATVTAPVAGVVSKKSVEVGQFVQAGQPLLAIVQDGDTWIVANFKETQLKKMRIGQPVELEVDAYPKIVFRGHVDSFAAATGAQFALLPPDNATGNFTKVVQRLPVKILLDRRDDAAHPLRAGMSVTAIVDVR